MCRNEEMGANIVKIEVQVSEEGRNGREGREDMRRDEK